MHLPGKKKNITSFFTLYYFCPLLKHCIGGCYWWGLDLSLQISNPNALPFPTYFITLVSCSMHQISVEHPLHCQRNPSSPRCNARTTHFSLIGFTIPRSQWNYWAFLIKFFNAISLLVMEVIVGDAPWPHQDDHSTMWLGLGLPSNLLGSFVHEIMRRKRKMRKITILPRRKE